MLKKHPKINVIVTFNEWTTLGVGYAIQELGLKDNVRVVAFDSNVVSVGMLETGEVDTLIVQNSYAMGYLGVETAYKLINGYSIKDTIYTDTILSLIHICSGENAQEIFRDFYEVLVFAGMPQGLDCMKDGFTAKVCEQFQWLNKEELDQAMDIVMRANFAGDPVTKEETMQDVYKRQHRRQA